MSTVHTLRPGLPQPPKRIISLPVNAKGYPVPFFVAWVSGEPDFRVVDQKKLYDAIHHKKCWLCGQPLGRNLCFVLGPMCAINRTISEPPSHHECAEWGVRACPFLTLPRAKRREANLPDDVIEPAGCGLKRNPGAVLLWSTRAYRVQRVSNGVLFRVGEPFRTEWYAEGRKATRAEVLESIESGLPLLRDIAEQEGHDAVAALDRMTAEAMRLLPDSETAPTSLEMHA